MKYKLFPIGFHIGPGGNAAGLLEYFLAPLDRAGIRFCLKSVDAYPLDAVNLAAASGVPHTIVWRSTALDVPNYDLPPVQAADEHYNATMAKLPPEFDKRYVWIENINEVDKGRSEWLAEFCLRWAQRAMADGYKSAHFGWSSGEPEPEHWKLPKMAEFLRFVGQHPTELAISLHEYSYDRNDIFRMYPWLVGRYRFLFIACDEMGIPRPTTMMTEWGWEYQDVPSVDRALSDIDAVAQEYVEHPQIIGGGLWYLGPGFGGIADKAQPIIRPLGEKALSWPHYVENEWPPGGSTTPPPGECIETTQFTKYHILRPRTMSASQWAWLTAAMTDGIDLPGIGKVQIGYEGWSHLDAMGAIKQAVQAGFTGSRLVVVDGHLIGDGLDADWMAANCPLLAEYTVYLRTSGGGPAPGDPVIYNIVEQLPTHPSKDYGTRPRTDITTVIVHHTTGDPYQSIENIAAYHVNGKGWPGIGYHFVIDGSGKIHMTNYVETLSYHSNYANPYGVAVCMQGNFTDVWPSDAQLKACLSLINYLKREIPTIWDTIPHREAPGSSTACPGNTFTQWWRLATGEEPPVEPPPPSGEARLGLHASADGGLASGELDAFKTARVELVKILSSMGASDVTALANALPGVPFVIRAFLHFGGRQVSPQQFFDWTVNDVRRAVDRLKDRRVIIELHNEPNLYAEGFGVNWSNGSQYAGWANELLQLYRSAFSGYEFAFPGLSPGGDVSGIRYDSNRFLSEASSAINAYDHLAVHAYWAANWPMSLALETVDTAIVKYPTKSIIVTEASNNKRTTSQDQKASEYIAFVDALRKRPSVFGVTYFIASASNPAWGWGSGSGEVWVGTSIPQIVGQR